MSETILCPLGAGYGFGLHCLARLALCTLPALMLKCQISVVTRASFHWFLVAVQLLHLPPLPDSHPTAATEACTRGATSARAIVDVHPATPSA